MSVSSLRDPLAPQTGAAQRTAVDVARLALLLTVLAGMGTLVFAPRLPLGDLPQHAGQVALLRDLLAHQSPWQSIVRINFFTPYLIGYGLTLLLSYAMPIATAFKVVLAGSYVAMVACSMKLRKHFGGDERLDWLFVPGFFGFAFWYGFVTFLVAAPIGLLFILYADRHASAPGLRRAAGVVALGIAMFFSHGLVFLFAYAIGVLMLCVRQRRPITIARHLGPYLLLGVLAVCYACVTYESDPLLALPGYLPHPEWGPALLRPIGFVEFPLITVGTLMNHVLLAPFSLFMFATPWLLGDRINARTRTAPVTFLVVLCVFLFVPHVAMKTAFLYERFALFILPAYALMFRRPTKTESAQQQDDARSHHRAMQVVVPCVLAMACWVYFGVQAVRMEHFATESAPFESILDAMAPGQRALSLIFDPDSNAIENPLPYRHYALWYQAERHGFVDYNFAWFLPQIARFKHDSLPPVRPGDEFVPWTFDWDHVQGRNYRYFIVRKATPLPAGFFANSECSVQLVRTAGEWSLYERTACH